MIQVDFYIGLWPSPAMDGPVAVIRNVGDEIDDDDDCTACYFFNAWPWLETLPITTEQRNAIQLESGHNTDDSTAQVLTIN